MKRLMLCLAPLLLLAAPAGAQEQREKPIEIFSVEEGLECTLIATNGESVWPGNVLRLVNGDQEFLVEGVEDSPNITTVVEFTSSSSLVTVGVLITEWSSLEAELSCAPPPPTTTTVPPSDCVQIRSGDGTSSCTTVPESTTSTTMATTTTQPTTTTTQPDPCPPDGLACTGASSLTPAFAALGLVLAALGALTLAWVRPLR